MHRRECVVHMVSGNRFKGPELNRHHRLPSSYPRNKPERQDTPERADLRGVRYRRQIAPDLSKRPSPLPPLIENRESFGL